MMVSFHFVYDLDYFGVRASDLDSGFWMVFARATAAVFILLAGLSLTLSFWRASKTFSPLELRLKFVRRGVRIFLWGMFITLATLVLLKEEAILFGVLHLIGVSIVLAYPLIGYRLANLILGLVLIAAGIYVQGVDAASGWFLWLGLAPAGFHTLDYFPLLPWFGVILLWLFFWEHILHKRPEEASGS